MANAPLPGRDGVVLPLIWGIDEAEYFCGQDWTGQITLKALQKIDFRRTSEICPTGRSEGAAQLVTILGREPINSE
jgi:hypothetical protein